MAAMLNIIHTRTTDHKLSKNNKAIKIVKRFTWIWHCINYITHYLLKGRASAHKTHSENIRLKTSVVRDIWWQHTSSGVPVTRCTFNTWFTAVGTVHTNKDLPNTAHNDALTQLRHIRIYKVAPKTSAICYMHANSTYFWATPYSDGHRNTFTAFCCTVQQDGEKNAHGQPRVGAGSSCK